MANKYQQGKIYKLCSARTNLCYIGSTCKSLTDRMSSHICSASGNGKYKYISAFQILQYPDANIELVELFPCSNSLELRQREQHWIDNTNCCNRFNAVRDPDYNKKYYEKNKEAILAKMAEYRDNNKEIIAERKSRYFRENKEKIAEYRRQEYVREKKRTCDAAYRAEKLSQKIQCECGSSVSILNYNKHTGTKKHKAATSGH